MLELIAGVCMFYAGIVTNCDVRINKFQVCASQLPEGHVRLITEWTIKDNRSTGRAEWGKKGYRVNLGEDGGCSLFRHEVGHIVQVEYKFPGVNQEQAREDFANAYSRAFRP